MFRANSNVDVIFKARCISVLGVKEWNSLVMTSNYVEMEKLKIY